MGIAFPQQAPHVPPYESAHPDEHSPQHIASFGATEALIHQQLGCFPARTPTIGDCLRAEQAGVSKMRFRSSLSVPIEKNTRSGWHRSPAAVASILLPSPTHTTPNWAREGGLSILVGF